MNFDKQLSTKETLVHILWVDSFACPQKPWEVISSDGDIKRSNIFMGPAQIDVNSKAT